jgi:hypothetical protein
MRTNAVVSLVLIMALIPTVGCHDGGPPTGVTETPSQFSYIAYDNNGNLMATGLIILQRQDSLITGARYLKGNDGTADSGSIGGTIHPDGSFTAVFDPNLVKYAYVSLVGKTWPTVMPINGEIVTFSGTAIWSLKSGTFQLYPLK